MPFYYFQFSNIVYLYKFHKWSEKQKWKKVIVKGVSCGHCVNHVKIELEELSEVNSVSIDFTWENAIIEDSNEVEDVGYEIVDIEKV